MIHRKNLHVKQRVLLISRINVITRKQHKAVDGIFVFENDSFDFLLVIEDVVNPLKAELILREMRKSNGMIIISRLLYEEDFLSDNGKIDGIMNRLLLITLYVLSLTLP